MGQSDEAVTRRLVEFKSKLTQEQWDTVLGGRPPNSENPVLVGPDGVFYLRKPPLPFQPYRVPDGRAAARDIFRNVLAPPEIERVERCSSEAQAQFLKAVYETDEDKDGQPDFHTERVKTALDRHDRVCLTPMSVESLDMAPLVPKVGALYSRLHGRIVCTLAKFADRAVVSARHCTAISRRGTNQYVSGEPGNFYVLMASDPRRASRAVTIREMDGTAISSGMVFSDANQANDLVLFEVADNLPGQAVSISSTVKANDRLVVPGVHVHLAYDLGRLPTLTATDAGDGFEARIGHWEEFLRVDKLATCRVFHLATRNGCIIHACQSEEGWSGGPIFGADSGDVVGVHSGAALKGSTCTAGLDRSVTKFLGSEAPNVGVSLVGQQVSSAAR